MSAAVWLAVAGGCAASGSYVWVDQYQAPENKARPHVLAPGDVLTMRVWSHDSVTTRAKVRDDGRVSLPLVGDVEVTGLRPEELAERLQVQFKPFFVNPVVTVALEETRPRTVSIAGEVARPGVFELGASTGVLDVISQAGGLTDYADRSAIFVLRRSGDEVERIRLTWDALVQGRGRAPSFRLQDGDQIVVE